VSEETNRDYRVALRVFGKRVTDEDGLPDSLAWITATTAITTIRRRIRPRYSSRTPTSNR